MSRKIGTGVLVLAGLLGLSCGGGRQASKPDSGASPDASQETPQGARDSGPAGKADADIADGSKDTAVQPDVGRATDGVLPTPGLDTSADGAPSKPGLDASADGAPSLPDSDAGADAALTTGDADSGADGAQSAPDLDAPADVVPITYPPVDADASGNADGEKWPDDSARDSAGDDSAVGPEVTDIAPPANQVPVFDPLSTVDRDDEYDPFGRVISSTIAITQKASDPDGDPITYVWDLYRAGSGTQTEVSTTDTITFYLSLLNRTVETGYADVKVCDNHGACATKRFTF